jgi:hypothetical protein
MNSKFEKFYDKKAKKIQGLREALKTNPENAALKTVIEEEERKLYQYVVTSGKELEKFMQHEREESGCFDDEE